MRKYLPHRNTPSFDGYAFHRFKSVIQSLHKAYVSLL